MSVENAIAKLLEESRKVNENRVTRDAVPAEGMPKLDADQSAEDEPSNKKNNVGTQKRAEGGTSKKSNPANRNAKAPDGMSKVGDQSYEDEPSNKKNIHVEALEELIGSELTEKIISEDEVELTEEELEVLDSITEEEMEQLDELSRKTLGNYIKKSARSSVDINDRKSKLERAKEDMRRASHDTDSDEVSDHTRKAISATNKKIDRLYDKDINRARGIHRAVKRLTKEDLDMSEDVNALFNGEDGLTEEFRQKAETIFEAAVVSRVREEVETIEEELVEEYNAQLNEAIEEAKEELVENVNGYLTLMVEQWMESNAVALQSGMKADILESFVEGMKGVFKDHYIEVPEDKFDLVNDLQEQVEELTERFNEVVATNVELKQELSEAIRQDIIDEACAGLSDVEADKLRSLSEELTFEDEDSFGDKLMTIRENYFGQSAKKRKDSPSILAEETIQENEVPAGMERYVSTISKLNR